MDSRDEPDAAEKRSGMVNIPLHAGLPLSKLSMMLDSSKRRLGGHLDHPCESCATLQMPNDGLCGSHVE